MCFAFALWTCYCGNSLVDLTSVSPFIALFLPSDSLNPTPFFTGSGSLLWRRLLLPGCFFSHINWQNANTAGLVLRADNNLLKPPFDTRDHSASYQNNPVALHLVIYVPASANLPWGFKKVRSLGVATTWLNRIWMHLSFLEDLYSYHFWRGTGVYSLTAERLLIIKIFNHGLHVVRVWFS